MVLTVVWVRVSIRSYPMVEEEIVAIFTSLMQIFKPAINILIAIVAAGAGIRWIIKIFVK